jgi:hypothetical protein
MICQSWKVMFQAEYSSGSPLRMLVDLRASVEHALGRGKAAEADAKGKPAAGAKPAAAAAKTTVPAAKPASTPAKPGATASVSKPAASKAPVAAKAATAAAGAKPAAKPAAPPANAPEFEVSGAPGWDPDSAAQPKKK